MSERLRNGQRAVIRLALALALAASVAGCSVLGGRGESAAPPVLRVGTSASYPPFTFAENGQPRGIEIDFAQALGAELGRRIEISVVPFPDLIGALNADKIDIIMAGLSRTPAREALVTFTAPYLQVGQMALVRAGDDRRFRTPASYDAPGVRIGFERGTTGAAYVRAHSQRAQPVEFANKDDALRALRAGEIDLFVHDAPFVWITTGSPAAPGVGLSGRYTPLTDESLAWALRKGDDALAARLDAIVRRWRANGEIDAVLDRWIKVRKVTLPLAAE